MPEQLKKFLGEGPYPCPLEEFDKFVIFHMTDKFVVLEPKLYLNYCGNLEVIYRLC